MATCYFAATDYRPKNWNTVKNLLENTTIFDNCRNKKDIIWLKLSCALITLDIYKENTIRRGFEDIATSTRKSNLISTFNRNNCFLSLFFFQLETWT